MKKVYLLLAEGFETIEALAPVDILRRGGVEVVTLSIHDSIQVKSAQNIIVHSDGLLSDYDLSDGDMLVLPGGAPGYTNLGRSAEVIKFSKKYLEDDKFLAAICGAPTILESAGLLKNRKITCHYGVRDNIKDGILAEKTEKIVQDEKLITASGAGIGIDFGLKLVEVLVGPEKVSELLKSLTVI